MNIKALVEKRNALLKEANEMLDKSIVEVRSLTAEETNSYEEKRKEAADLDKTIEMLEKRASEDAEKELEKRKGEEKEVEEKRELTLSEKLEVEKRAVSDYIQGNITAEVRAMTTNASSGGITVPTQLHNEVIAKLYEVAPLFAKARKFTPVAGTLEILREDNIGTAAFVGEMNALTPNDFAFDKVKLEQKRCGSAVELSQQLINDSGINVVDYAKNTLVKRLGLMLDRTVVNGQKETQFEGLLSANKEKCEIKAAKVETDIDDYRTAFNSMNVELVGGAEWVMSRKEFDRLSKLKDGIGHYYIAADIVNGQPVYKLHGLPINITDAMPELTGVQDQVAAILVNMPAAYATMVKKKMEMKQISGDTTQALRGSHLLLLDIYADGKIINEQAIRLLTTGSAPLSAVKADK